MSFVRRAAAAAAALGAGAAWLLLRDQTTDSDETGEAATAAEAGVQRGAQGLGARAVEALSRHVGERGSGPKGSPGYHRGRFVDEVSRGVWGDAGDRLLGKPWCARAVRWAYETAARELGLQRPIPAGLGTMAMARSWKAAPLDSYKVTEPRPGVALVLGDSHVALVARVTGPGEVVTVEGNHGDAVAHVKRKLKPGDTLVDVEAWAAAARGGRGPAGPLVAGLDLLGTELEAPRRGAGGGRDND